MKTTITAMNTLCDQLIEDMRLMPLDDNTDTALLTGLDSFNTIREAKDMAQAAGQFNGKAIAWKRGEEWLQFTFKKDEDCESGWAITARWLDGKPAWVKTPPKPEMTTVRVPRALAYQVEQYVRTLVNAEVAS